MSASDPRTWPPPWPCLSNLPSISWFPSRTPPATLRSRMGRRPWAIAVGRGLGPAWLLYVGRLTTLALARPRLLGPAPHPDFRVGLFVLLLMPMSLFEAASVSADAPTNGSPSSDRLVRPGGPRRDGAPGSRALTKPLSVLLVAILLLVPCRRLRRQRPLPLVLLGGGLGAGSPGGPGSGTAWLVRDRFAPLGPNMRWTPGSNLGFILNERHASQPVMLNTAIGLVGRVVNELPWASLARLEHRAPGLAGAVRTS